MKQERVRVTTYQALILLQNILSCSDASNDADRTVPELITELNRVVCTLPTPIVESALYCCNINSKDGKFWHPKEHTFDDFVKRFLPPGREFNREYNYLKDIK